MTYTKVTWNTGEVLSRDKLTQMTTNEDYLNQTMPKTRFMNSDVNTMKILVGREAKSAGNVTSWYTTVNFDNFFSEGCPVIVIPSIASTVEDEIYQSVRGLGSGVPDNKGCRINNRLTSLSGKKKTLEGSLYVQYAAFGY